MHMSANLTETLGAAIRDGEELVAWAEPNAAALNDERVDAAVLRALGGPVPADLAIGVPLLRYANTDLPAVPLIQAVIGDIKHSTDLCDRCETPRRPVVDFLLVPAGASVVSVSVCRTCRGAFDHDPRFRNTHLVWA